jgi:hypothetical protein
MPNNKAKKKNGSGLYQMVIATGPDCNTEKKKERVEKKHQKVNES